MSLALRRIRRSGARENILAPVTSLRMNNQESGTYKKQKILLRDRELKDNIMAVQRRIPRFGLQNLVFCFFILGFHILSIFLHACR